MGRHAARDKPRSTSRLGSDGLEVRPLHPERRQEALYPATSRSAGAAHQAKDEAKGWTIPPSERPDACGSVRGNGDHLHRRSHNACVNTVVRRNVVWGNHGNGIHFNGDLSQGGNGLILNALVERNIIYDNGLGGGSGINCDGVQNSRIQNNLLYNNHASGISLYRIDAADGAKNNVVVNNTIVQAADGRWALNIKNGSTGNKAYHGHAADGLGRPPTLSGRHNCSFGLLDQLPSGADAGQQRRYPTRRGR